MTRKKLRLFSTSSLVFFATVHEKGKSFQYDRIYQGNVRICRNPFTLRMMQDYKDPIGTMESNHGSLQHVVKHILSITIGISYLLCSNFSIASALESASSVTGIDYTCLACQCGSSLIKSLKDPRALVELSCLGTCGQDDFGCLMRCGNLYEDDVLHDFNVCAISDKKCIPQWQEKKPAKMPDLSLLPSNFNPQLFSGDWYISYGLNSIFDCFDCQKHVVYASRDRLLIDVEYDVQPMLKGKRYTRKLQHVFVRNPDYPAVFHASDQSYLHQSDDWYILDADPDKYILVYYTGCNDAWCGYDGGIIYSREPTLDAESRGKIRDVASKFNIKFSEACPVDHSKCLTRKDNVLL